MTKTELLMFMRESHACADATKWVSDSKAKTAATLWRTCERGDWMLWIAARAGIDRKLLVTAACLCARESLRHVKPGEERPRLAIEAAERWVRGEATIEEVREARRQAWKAAYAAYAAAADADADAYAYAADADAAAYAAYDAAAAAAAAYAAAYAAAAAAYAAAYAAYDAAAYAYARKLSLARSADLVRTVISSATVAKAIKARDALSVPA